MNRDQIMQREQEMYEQEVEFHRAQLKRIEDNRSLECRQNPNPDAPKALAIYELWGLLDDALRQAQREMGIDPSEEELAPAPSGLCPMLGDLAHRLHVELDRARQVLAEIQQAKMHMNGGATVR